MDYIQLMQKKKNYIILNFNYLLINTFLVIFLNQKVWFILNPIRKISLPILLTTFWTKKKKTYSTKEVKRIKINLDFIFNNFPVHRTGLRLVSLLLQEFTHFIFTTIDTHYHYGHNIYQKTHIFYQIQHEPRSGT